MKQSASPTGFGWTQYLLSGSIAVILSWALSMTLSGCYFGNYEQDPPPLDPISGYYETQPSSAQACVTLSGGSQQCTAINASQLPTEFTQGLPTDPVVLALVAGTTSVQFIDPASGTISFSGTVASDMKTISISYDLGQGGAFSMFGSQYCGYTSQLSGTAILDDPNGPFTTNTQETMMGRINIASLVVTNTLTGSECPTLLAQLVLCYGNEAKCPGPSDVPDEQSTQQELQSLFNPYIQASFMTEAQIPNVTSWGYSISYQ